MKEKIIWTTGLVLFSVMISWMFIDILGRESNFSNRSNVLVVGTSAVFKPFEYREGGEDIKGFDIDIAKEIAKSLGKELKVEDMQFDGLLPALESGQIDMAIAGMSKTPEREKNTLFSNSYYKSSQKIIVRNNSDIRNKFALEGRKIGVQLGTTGDTVASNIKGSKVYQFPNATSVLQELQSNGVDAVILDEQPAEQYIFNFRNLEILNSSLANEDYAVAVKKGNQDLVNKINHELTKMRSDGRYDSIFKKYFRNGDINKIEGAQKK